MRPCILGAAAFALGFRLLAEAAPDSPYVLSFFGTVISGLLGLVSYLAVQLTRATQRQAEMSQVLAEDLRLTRQAVIAATDANLRGERIRQVFVRSMVANQKAIRQVAEGMGANQEAVEALTKVLVGVFKDYQPKGPEQKGPG